MDGKMLLVGVVVFVTHALEGITGFGCTALALPFVAMILGVKPAVTVLVALAWLLAGYIILRSRRNIVWREFFRIVLPVGLGLPFGMLLFRHLPEGGLKAFLACVMAGVGVHGLVRMRRNGAAPGAPEERSPAAAKPAAPFWMRGILFAGGVAHGAFGTGGPFVVVYAARALPEKSLFRVTICLLWFLLNSLLMAGWTYSGDVWSETAGTALLWALPFLLGGMVLGDALHHRVDERVFRVIVYLMLLGSGLAMAYSLF